MCTDATEWKSYQCVGGPVFPEAGRWRAGRFRGRACRTLSSVRVVGQAAGELVRRGWQAVRERDRWGRQAGVDAAGWSATGVGGGWRGRRAGRVVWQAVVSWLRWLCVSGQTARGLRDRRTGGDGEASASSGRGIS